MSTITIQSPHQTWTSDRPRTFRIGREADNDIVGVDPSVSRYHAEIRALGDGWEIVDIGSSAGTWVGGQRVQRAELRGTTAVSFGAQGGGMSVMVTVTGQVA
ncbi:MAG: FHA domain-containing protein, partial [Nocardioides sp.]|nr:FHA domain-containing protein [Nocardioides sp.]